MLIFLWTDIFLWGLVLFTVILFYKLRNKHDIRMSMLQLYESKTAVLSIIILFVYIVIGLMDSIHYRPKLNHHHLGDTHISTNISVHYGDVKSVLDYILLPWSSLSEKTFSEPFANRSFVKERVIEQDGTIREIYPSHSHSIRLENYANINYFLILSFVGLVLSMILLFIYKYTKDRISMNLTSYKIILANILILYFFTSVLLILYKSFHVLGTDKIGQDIFYVTLKSVRTGLVIGTITSIFMVPFAILFGTMAGYFGGFIDDIIQYVYTTLSSIPSILLISAFILIIQTQIALHSNWFETLAEQADLRMLALCIILGITSWSGLCRLIRAETLKLKELDYILAAKSMKVSNRKIIFKHIIPNLVHIIIINIAISFSALVLAEAVLSYIGVGVDPTTMSWGNMINSARQELSRDPVVWWPILGAFVPMFIFVLSLNLFADKLRDAFDPRIRLQ